MIAPFIGVARVSSLYHVESELCPMRLYHVPVSCCAPHPLNSPIIGIARLARALVRSLKSSPRFFLAERPRLLHRLLRSPSTRNQALPGIVPLDMFAQCRKAGNPPA